MDKTTRSRVRPLCSIENIAAVAESEKTGKRARSCRYGQW
uniref:Uncharacterized protein n=1 Tax=Lepeophtheirus salmonis TaxID=72036 RepID=A0A0K2UG87_LEPSM